MNMSRLRPSWEYYLLAVAAVAAACLLCLIAGPREVDSDVRYFGFAIAVLLSSTLGGLGPGLLATSMAALAAGFLLPAPVFPIQFAPEERMARLILFVGEGLLLSLVGGMIHGAPKTEIDSPWPKRYLAPILFVLGATGLKLLAWRDMERDFPFACFYAATAASAWIGGFGPALVSTLLATLSARYFFIDPPHSISLPSKIDAARELLFIAEGLILSFLTAQYPLARRYANQAMEQMREYRHRLLKGAEDARALRAISRDTTWEWDLRSIATLHLDESEESARAGADADFAAWLRPIHPKDRLKIVSSLKSTIEQGHPEWNFEYRRRSPGKGYVRVSDHAFIIRDHAWNPVRVVGRTAEVSEEKGTTQGSGSEGPYRALFENNPHAILLADNGLRIIAANEAACDVLGYGRNELTRLSLDDVLGRSAKGMLLGLNQEDPLSITFEEDCVRATGEVFRAKVSAAIVSATEKAAAGRIITIEEVSEPDAAP